jgi:short subunit dehydrogenase-like uncharacterized protein
MGNRWLLYGANGYTGSLIAREAVRRGEHPCLAGRSPEVEDLSRELGLPFRRFPCEDAAEIARELRREGADLVLHCAGPFSATSRPMMEACITAGAHYLDITGEIPVFERAQRLSSRFKEAGIVGMPGVGFDIVPSDCLAARLVSELPDTVELEMALSAGAGTSPGTTKTLIEGLHAGALIRKDGRLLRVPAASEKRDIVYWPGLKPKMSVIFPWGDVSTAFYTTGVPNIRFFIAIQPGFVALLRAGPALGPLLTLRPVQNGLQALAQRFVKGPDDATREGSNYYLWGRARNAAGKTHELRMKTPNGYTLTVDSALKAVVHVRGGGVAPGAWTPAGAFGWRFALELEGVVFG